MVRLFLWLFAFVIMFGSLELEAQWKYHDNIFPGDSEETAWNTDNFWWFGSAGLRHRKNTFLFFDFMDLSERDGSGNFLDIDLSQVGNSGLAFNANREPRGMFAYDPRRDGLWIGSRFPINNTVGSEERFYFSFHREAMSASNDGFARFGNRHQNYLTFDEDDIQARNSGVSSHINLNRFGGDVIIGNYHIHHDVSSQQVGIGFKNPKAKLHVKGKRIRLDGILDDPSSLGVANLDVGYEFYHEQEYLGGLNYLINGITADDGIKNHLRIENNQSGAISLRAGQSDRLTVLEDGRVGINNTMPNTELDVHGSGNFTGELTAASDLKLKHNIRSLENGGKLINQLNPVVYHYRHSEFPQLNLSPKKRIGFIAQEVETILPTLITWVGEKDQEGSYRSVNYIDLIPIIVKAFQEQEEQISAMKKMITAYEKRLGQLENTIK